MKFELIAVDPLANEYEKIKSKYDVNGTSQIHFSFVEDVSSRFPSEYFDAVICTNALDHSFNPIWGLLEMFIVLKKNCKLFLAHRVNEAEFENYTGLHQWNFSEKNGSFLIWNKGQVYNVTTLFSPFADVRVELRSDFINVEITKQRPFDFDLIEYQKNMRALTLESLLTV